jgi:hypothetical protein
MSGNTVRRCQFDLGQRVEISESGERAMIEGRAEYITADPTYFIRYKTAEGVAVEKWWTETALKAASE